MLKNYLFGTLSLFQPSFSFSFSTAHFFFFSFSWSAAPFSSSLFFRPSFSFLLVCCPLFFSPNVFQPKKTFSAQNVFASAQNFFQFSPKRFFFFFQFSHSSISALLFSAPPPFSVSFQLLSLRSNVLFSCFTSFLFE